jgi:hypothetical protein
LGKPLPIAPSLLPSLRNAGVVPPLMQVSQRLAAVGPASFAYTSRAAPRDVPASRRRSSSPLPDPRQTDRTRDGKEAHSSSFNRR